MPQPSTSYVGLFRILPTPGIENFTSGNVYGSLGEIMQLPYADSILEDIGEANIDLTSVTTPLVVDLLTVDNTQTFQGLEGVAIPAKVWGDTFSVSTDVSHADITLTHPFASPGAKVEWDSYYDTIDKSNTVDEWHGKVPPNYSSINLSDVNSGNTDHQIIGVVSNQNLVINHFPSKSLLQNILHKIHDSPYTMKYDLGHKNGGSKVKAREVGRQLLSHTDRNFTYNTTLGWKGLNGYAVLDHTNSTTGGDYLRVHQPTNAGNFSDNTNHAFEFKPAQSWDVAYGGDIPQGTQVKISMRVRQADASWSASGADMEGTTMSLVVGSGAGLSEADFVQFDASGLIEIIHTWAGPLTGVSDENASLAFKTMATAYLEADISEVSIRPYKEHDVETDKFIDSAGNVFQITDVDPDQTGLTNKIRIAWDNSMPTPTPTGGDWTIIDPNDEVIV